MFDWFNELGDTLTPKSYDEAREWHYNLMTFESRIQNVVKWADPLGNRLVYTDKYHREYDPIITCKLMYLQGFMDGKQS